MLGNFGSTLSVLMRGYGSRLKLQTIFIDIIFMGRLFFCPQDIMLFCTIVLNSGVTIHCPI